MLEIRILQIFVMKVCRISTFEITDIFTEQVCSYNKKKILSIKDFAFSLQYEEFALNSDLTVRDNKVVEKLKKEDEGSSDSDVVLAAQTTFNLSLTEDQRRSKNMLLLPHTRYLMIVCLRRKFLFYSSYNFYFLY